jgi:DNA-binding LacI/PurR family transcriptional regulator
MKYVLTLFGILFIAGCTVDREEREIKIAISFAGDHPITIAQYYQGIEDITRDYKVSVTVQSALMNHELQQRQIDTLLTDNPSVVALEVVDPHRGEQLISRIEAAGVPVIGFNRLAAGTYDLVVTPDYKTIARETAEMMIRQLGTGDRTVVLVRDQYFGPQDSLFAYTIAAILEDPGNFTVRHMHISDIEMQFLPPDAVVCTTPESLRYLVSSRARMPDKLLLIGPAQYELLDDPVSVTLMLIDIRPYDAGARIVESAAGYARGAFRHRHTDVIRVGDELFPVVYTPHRITIYND